MESALYGIYPLVVFVSEILLVRCAHSFDFWYVNNSCVNTVRQHFPWSILYICNQSAKNVYINLERSNNWTLLASAPSGEMDSINEIHNLAAVEYFV